MPDLDIINLDEFQNCGEIMVAVKSNKFVMVCKFCLEIFTQLQAFMRHLQLHHNNRLEFVKEIDVYAVEELMNHTTVSCATSVPAAESDESCLAGTDINQLFNEMDAGDMKWLEEGVLSKDKQNVHGISYKVDEKGNTLSNMAILKALEDCDVSFNMLDSFNETICIDEDTTKEQDISKSDVETDDILNNSLIRQIHNDWEDSDYIMDSSKNDTACYKKENPLKKTKDMQEHVDFIEGSKTNSKIKQTKEDNDESNTTNGLKKLLEISLNSLEDVDGLLQNLEDSINLTDLDQNNKYIISKQKTNDCSSSIKSFLQKLTKDLEIIENEEELIASSKQLELNTTKKTSQVNSAHNEEPGAYNEIPIKFLSPDTIQTIGKNNTTNLFETKLKELELLLDIKSTDDTNSISANKDKGNKITENNKEFSNILPNILDQESLIQKHKICTSAEKRFIQTSLYNINFKHDLNDDFEFKLKSFENSSQYYYKSQNITHQENNENNLCASYINEDLNKDLTKAFAEALGDDDLESCNRYQENDAAEPLNKELQNLLDIELNENEKLSENIENIQSKLDNIPPGIRSNDILKELNETRETCSTPNNSISEDKVSLNTVQKTSNSHILNLNIDTNIKKPEIKLKENCFLKTNGPAINNLKIKYEKTNLKAKTKLNGKQKVTIYPKENRILKETVTILHEQRQKQTRMIKGDLKAFKEQKEYQVINQPFLQSPQKQQNCNILNTNGNKQSKTAIKDNKENCAITLNKLNIKLEKLTPNTNFINTRRGERTPLKQEKMFLKQSTKSQEKLNDIITKTTPNTATISQTKCLKPSPKSVGNPSNRAAHNKTTISVGKTATKTYSNSSSKTYIEQLNLNLTPPQEQPKLNSRKETISPKTPAKNKTPELITSVKRQSARLNQDKVEKTSPRENKTKTNLPKPLTTPQRVKKLSVKLPKCTPEKLLMQLAKKSKSPPFNTETNSSETFLGTLKLPENIRITKLPVADISNTKQSQCNEIVETPVKSTYCKQNFSEASLKAKENYKTMPPDTKLSKLKTETLVSPLRQRTASIDILPAASNSNDIHKTPRHSNLDNKSYAVGRTARKTEVLQRMRHIKKQIFKTIEYSNCKIKPLPQQNYKTKKVHIENVQNLPDLQKKILTPLLNRANNFKEPNNSLFSSATTPSPSNNFEDKQKSSYKLVEKSNVMLSCPIKENEKLVKKNLKRPATSPLLNEENPAKRTHRAIVETKNKLERKNFISNTKPNESPQKSSLKEHEFDSLQEEGNSYSSATKQLELSDSAIEFLQRNIEANRLNVQSIINHDLPIDDDITPDATSLESNSVDNNSEDLPQKDSGNKDNNDLIDNLMEQLHKEQNSKNSHETDGKKLTINNGSIKDFNESQDIELLEMFGLKIIKQTDIENNITLEELEFMLEKVKQFVNIYKCWPRIWSSKAGSENTTTSRIELQTNIKHILNNINVAFNLNLSINDLKRLINLITFWYDGHISRQLIEKKKISETTNRFLLMFGFIPKTTRRLYFCEYCEEYFNTKHKYYSHRIKHTGDLFPYTCQKCFVKGYKILKALKDHESICKPIENATENITDYQCQLCAQQFDTSDQLYEHSKKHLNGAYICTKCQLVFAAAIDVKNHMAICNKSVKNMPQQNTPRPVERNKVGRPSIKKLG